MRRTAGGLVSLVAALALTSCSGAGAGEGRTPVGGSSGTASADGGATPAVQGRAERVSVASVVVPAALTFQSSSSSTDPELDEVTWTAAAAGSAAPVCRIILGVQSGFPGESGAYRQYLADILRLTDIRDDPDAPDGVEGVLARGGGPGDGTPQDPAFVSALRTWVTPGRTKITVSVTSAESSRDQCDPEAVVSTLSWDGTERAVPSATPAT